MKTSKYKKEYCEQLVEHMAKGFSFITFGAIINVGKTTLEDWARKHDDFAAAKELGEMKSQIFYEDKAQKKVSELLDKDSQATIDGQMLQFLMRSRFRDQYTERKEIHAKVEKLEDLIFSQLDNDE